MKYYTNLYIHCDHKNCPNEITIHNEDRTAAYLMEFQAAKLGWHITWGGEDLCPVHATELAAKYGKTSLYEGPRNTVVPVGTKPITKSKKAGK